MNPDNPRNFREFFIAATGPSGDPYPYQERLARDKDFPEPIRGPIALGLFSSIELRSKSRLQADQRTTFLSETQPWLS